MIDGYSGNIKDLFKVKSLISNLAKDLFVAANSDLAAKRVTCISASTTPTKKSIIIFVACLLMLGGTGGMNAANRFSVATGNWNATSTWAATSGGAAGASAPVAGDVVTIEAGRTVTVTAAAACASITFSANNASNTLAVNSGVALTVSGAITIPRAATLFINTISVGAGNLNAGSIAFTSGGTTVRHQITISTGTVTVTGDVTGTSGNTSGSIIFTGAGLLRLGGAIFAPADGTLTTFTGSTVEYYAAGAQSISNFAYSNLTISGSGTKTLQGPTTVNNALTLTSGVLATTTTNLLSITNTSATAIVGGSTTCFINGPVKWTLPAILSSGSTYNFPVGSGTTYLPFALVNPTTGTGTITAQVQAFNSNAGGTFDGTITSISNLEYWQLTTIGNFTTSSVSLTRQTAITPLNAVGGSTALAGTYTSLNGTAGANAVTGSDAIGSKRYFVLAAKPPIVTTSIANLIGFTYIYDFGPSGEQSFTVSGTSLTTDVTVTAPVDFEISTTPGTGFQSSIALHTVGSILSPTLIYVRLKAGLAVGSYGYITAESILLTSDASTKSVTCKGFVTSSNPYIIAGGGITCDNDSIYLTSSGPNILNQYWTGPNSFYSTAQNPTIPSITASNSGTYTVTGSILSGINLLANPGFESGNTGFSTDYTYTTTSLVPEGNYAIMKIPHDYHSAFSHTPPHSGVLQMVVNGKGTTANVWTETVAVVPNTNYQFSYWEQSVHATSPSKLQLSVNSQLIGNPYTAPSDTAVWKQFFYNWNSGANTSAILKLQNMNYDANGNDFAIDDLDFEPLMQVSSSVNITVGSQAAGVTITASPTTVNAGANVTYSAIPKNGGSNPAYQWSVNGVNVGTNSPTLNYVPTSSSDVVTCVMTSNKSCVTGSPATSNSVSVTVNGTRNYWIGSPTSTQWYVPGNWTKTVVPAPGDDVEFATVGNNSGNAALNDLVVDANHTIGNLINQTTNRKLLINPAKFLVVNQNINTNSADRIYIQSSSTVPNGSLIFHNTQSSPAYATVEMYSKATRNSTGVTVGGRTYYYTWQYFGVPLSSVVADPTFYGSFIRTNYENSKDTLGKWTSLANADVLSPFKGYEITQDAPTTIVFQGQLVNRDATIILPYTSDAYDPGQTILANPYTAAIDVRQLIFDSNTEKTVYLYNTGSFGQWFNNSGESTYSESTNTPGQYLAIPQRAAGDMGLPNDIPSMSGYLVKAKGLAGGKITINYNSVVIKNVNTQRVSQSNQSSDKVYMDISLKGEHYGDRMWLINEPGTTRDFDDGWDGYKLSGAVGTPKLFAMEESGNYQVSTSDDLNNTYLGFQAGIDLEDTLTFKNENIELKYDGVYLVDLIENKVINIVKSGTQYIFKTESTPAPVKRFKIVTEPYIKNAADLATKLKMFNDNNTVFVDNPGSEKGELYFYDLMGRYLRKEIFEPNSVSSFSLFSISGVYIVKAVTGSEKVSKQIIVKQ
jgi:hypothetical protein